MRCKRRQEAPIERVGGRVPTHTRGTRARTQHAVLAHNLAIRYTFVSQAPGILAILSCKTSNINKILSIFVLIKQVLLNFVLFFNYCRLTLKLFQSMLIYFELVFF